jgi:hypothetical protein
VTLQLLVNSDNSPLGRYDVDLRYDANALAVAGIPSIGGTDTWVTIQTFQPPTAVSGSFLDGAATNGASFYRIRVQKP